MPPETQVPAESEAELAQWEEGAPARGWSAGIIAAVAVAGVLFTVLLVYLATRPSTRTTPQDDPAATASQDSSPPVKPPVRLPPRPIADSKQTGEAARRSEDGSRRDVDQESNAPSGPTATATLAYWNSVTKLLGAEEYRQFVRDPASARMACLSVVVRIRALPRSCVDQEVLEFGEDVVRFNQHMASMFARAQEDPRYKLSVQAQTDSRALATQIFSLVRTAGSLSTRLGKRYGIEFRV